MVRLFPFVVLPSNATPWQLSAARPCLFLAILTIASIGEPALQRDLEARFREYIASHVIVEGEKSLDLLQGLLVYLGWYDTTVICCDELVALTLEIVPPQNRYQHYFIAGRQQFWRFWGLGLSMIRDLKLDCVPDSLPSVDVGATGTPDPLMPASTGDRHYNREAQRVYLGWYHISVL